MKKTKININAVGIVSRDGNAIVKTVEVNGLKFSLLLMEDKDLNENYYECYHYDEDGIFEEDYICDVDVADNDEELTELIRESLKLI